ncbi:MAG: tetratricopeptide repeat protein [Sandaracinaceae bacterium]
MAETSAAQRVAIVGDDDPTFVEDLRAALQGAGMRSRVLTVSSLKSVTRAPDLTLILGDAAKDGGLAVVDAIGEERGPFAVVLAAGSLSVRLEARTRGLSVIPRPDDGTALGREVERALDSAGSATDVTTSAPRMAMNPGAPVADLDWEDDSETIQHVEAEAAPTEDVATERESLPEIGAGPSGLGRTFPRREIGYRTTLQGLSPGDQDVTVAAPEATTEALKERASQPGEERSTQPESRRSTKPDPRKTKPDAPPKAAPATRPSQDLRRRSTRPESRRRRSTRPGRRLAQPGAARPEAETRMVPDPMGPHEAKTKMQAPPAGPSSETRVVPDPTAPLYEEPTRHAPSDYTKRLAEAVDDPDATAPHRPVSAREPTSHPSEQPTAEAPSASELPQRAAPKRPSTPPRRSQPPPRGVQALEEGEATSGQPDTAQLASPRRAAPPSSPSAPSAPPIPLLPKPPQPVDAGYSKPPPPAKPPRRPRPALTEESDTGAPIPLLRPSASLPAAEAAPRPEPASAPPRTARWPIWTAALLVLGSLAGAVTWVMLPSMTGTSDTPTIGAPSPIDARQAEAVGAPTVGSTDAVPVTEAPEATQPEATQPEATQPEATQPEATQPEATQPEATQPEATQPEATQPEEAPVDVPAALREGRRHTRGRRWDQARAAFERALTQGENPDAHEGLAQVALAQENAAEALRHAEEAVRLRRTRARYHRLLGDARRLGGDEPGARRAYERAVSLDPEDEAADRL